MKNIVVIGGGTGVFTVLDGLKHLPVNLTAIVTVADNGGSSGILREEFGVLPPGDIRRALVALSPATSLLAKLFNYRFKNGFGLKGHSFGNLFLTALEDLTKDYNRAIEEAGKILGIKGRVIPVSLTNTHLVARLENNQLIIGETNIDKPRHDGKLAIKEVLLTPEAKANPAALRTILKADYIIIGPGDLYTSIIPNFLVKGISQAIKKSRAQVIYICNIMTKYGETTDFTAEKFLEVIEKYLGKGVIDYFIVNSEKPPQRYLKAYEKEKSELVVCANKKKLEQLKKPKVIFAKLVRHHPLLRHHPKKLAQVISKIINIT